jgi:hypothetical protein
MDGVTDGFVVGKAVIEGVRCDHLAFRAPHVDLQVWVQPVETNHLVRGQPGELVGLGAEGRAGERGERLGHRRAGAVLCAGAIAASFKLFDLLVPGTDLLALSRPIQAILLEAYPPRERGLAMAIYAMGAVLGPILGPLLGGYITDN